MARYSELENKHIQLELNLKLVQENLTKAKEETEGMFGETLTTAETTVECLYSAVVLETCVFSFFTRK